MKNLKTTILSAFIAFSCLTNGIAQENKLKASDGKKGHKKVVLSLGGGTSMPSSDGKDKAFLSNSTAINADLFLPLIRKGWDGGGARDHVKGHKMYFGLNVGGTYNFGGSGGFGTTPNPFAVTGQTLSMVSDRGAEAAPGFRMGAGPQANFYFGKFIVSPMVLGEYFSMTQKEMSIVQTTEYNGQSYDFNLATLPETKTSGFAVTPKLRLHYMFNDRFGLFADASYTMGPKIETTLSQLIPNGNPSPQSGSYNIQQLQTGTMVKGETKSTAYSAMGFNFGVVIGLGGNGHGDNLTNGIVKPACTCCGSKFHATGECPKYPNCHNVNASATSQVSISDLQKAQGDIKKGWDGTVKGLFVGKNLDIFVAKNGGVEKFIEQINKLGEVKASIEKYGDKHYVKIESKKEVSYYPFDNTPQFTIINSGGLGCSNSICSTCGPIPSVGPCVCAIPASDLNPLPVSCASPISVPVSSYLPHLNTEALATPISTDNNGYLTASSVKDIKNLLLAQLPNLVIDKTEIIKDGNESYVVVSATDNDKPVTLVNRLFRPSPSSYSISLPWRYLVCKGICYDAAGCNGKRPVLSPTLHCPCVAGGGLNNCNVVPYMMLINDRKD